MYGLMGLLIGGFIMMVLSVFSNKEMKQIDERQPYIMQSSKAYKYLLIVFFVCLSAAVVYVALNIKGVFQYGAPKGPIIFLISIPVIMYSALIYVFIKIKVNRILVAQHSVTFYHLGFTPKQVTMKQITKLTTTRTRTIIELDDRTIYTYDTILLLGIDLFKETLTKENPNCIFE